MTVTHRLAFCAGAIFLAVSLLLHDWNLYPNLRPWGVPILSLLRLLLLAVPLAAGWWIASGRGRPLARLVVWATWLFFLPYTLYCVTEIRHVAELCRLLPGIPYTSGCVERLWTLYPIFIYALSGMLIFVFSVTQVTARCIADSSRKRMCILGLCLYASVSSVIGLYTRFNMWHLFTHPKETFFQVAELLGRHSVRLNIVVFWIFSTIAFFCLTRLLYNARKYGWIYKSPTKMKS